MGFFSEININSNYQYTEYADCSYPSPETQLLWRIEHIKDWLRRYGCEFVESEDLPLICEGFMSKEMVYIMPEELRYPSDALRELGWCYNKLKEANKVFCSSITSELKIKTPEQSDYEQLTIDYKSNYLQVA